MNKSLLVLSVALLLIMSSYGYAIQVTDIQSGLENNQAEIQELKATLEARISSLESSLDGLATKDELTTLLTNSLIKTVEILEVFRSNLVVTFAFIGMAIAGLTVGLLLYLKSKGRM